MTQNRRGTHEVRIVVAPLRLRPDGALQRDIERGAIAPLSVAPMLGNGPNSGAPALSTPQIVPSLSHTSGEATGSHADTLTPTSSVATTLIAVAASSGRTSAPPAEGSKARESRGSLAGDRARTSTGTSALSEAAPPIPCTPGEADPALGVDILESMLSSESPNPAGEGGPPLSPPTPLQSLIDTLSGLDGQVEDLWTGDPSLSIDDVHLARGSGSAVLSAAQASTPAATSAAAVTRVDGPMVSTGGNCAAHAAAPGLEQDVGGGGAAAARREEAQDVEALPGLRAARGVAEDLWHRSEGKLFRVTTIATGARFLGQNAKERIAILRHGRLGYDCYQRTVERAVADREAAGGRE